jgi:uncharacterized Zn-binding protein involved in type VI secretion/proteasome lid subunit RPN8/RPN11
MATPGVPPIPHVGGPIAKGYPTVIIGMMPAARVGDMAICVGPPDAIAMGSMTVLIGGMPAARMGDLTTHGGTIVMGCPTVLIGDMGGGGAGGGGGGGGAGAGVGPAAAPPPTADEILADPTVRAELRQAWLDSDDGGSNDHEEGGYIVRRPDGSLGVVRLPTGGQDSMTPDLYPTGRIGDDEIVGFFHTHPNTGTTYQDAPSDADISFTQDNPETTGPNHFVLSPNDVYHIDNAGTVTTVGTLNDAIGE